MRGKGIKAWPPIAGVLAIAIGLIGVSVPWASAGDNDGNASVTRKSNDVAVSRDGKSGVGIVPNKLVDPAAKGATDAGQQRIDFGNLIVVPTDPSTWPKDMPDGMIRSTEAKMFSVVESADVDSAGPTGVLAEGGAGRNGDICGCDLDCGSNNVCFSGFCTFDETSQQFECLEFPKARGTSCESDSDPCTFEMCDGSTSATACVVAMCGGGARICTRCPKECVGGQDQEGFCDRDEDCLGGVCEEKSGIAAGSCAINGTDFVCSIAGAQGRCCDPLGALAPLPTDEATCLADATRGLWRRYTDPDDLNDPNCPKFSAGIGPEDNKATDAARDSFVIMQTARGCTLAGKPADDDSPECTDATLDCVGICKDDTGDPIQNIAGRFGLSCKSNSDCPDQAGCPGGICTCGTVSAGDVVCDVWSAKCPVEGDTPTAPRPASYTMVCDDYTMPNAPGWVQLREFRFRGGPESPGDAYTIEFRGLDDVVHAAAGLASRDGGALDRTIQFDCSGNCQPGQNPAEPVIYIPRTGKVCIRSSAAQTTRTFMHWIAAEGAAVDVGTSDPTVMWVDRNDLAGLVQVDLLAGSSNMIFEIDGTKVVDTDVLWACCDGGPCLDTSIAACTYCDGGPFSGTRCDFNRDCGSVIGQEFNVCNSKQWQGPQTSLDVAFGNGEKCIDGTCSVGACCTAGACSITAAGACPPADYQGDGTDCEPNCCTQPLVSAGDCCEDTLYCSNGNTTVPLAALACLFGKVEGDPCDASSGNVGTLVCTDTAGGDLGTCASTATVGDACSAIGVGSTFTGTCQPATCRLCAGPAAVHSFVVPPSFSENRCAGSGKFCDAFGDPVCSVDGSLVGCGPGTLGNPCAGGTGTCVDGLCGAGEGACDPFNPIEVRLISGVAPNPFEGTTVTGAEGDLCAEKVGASEGGQYEVFALDSPARVTISWCCNSPPESPVFFVIFGGCATCNLLFRDAGSFSFGPGGGAAASCPDGGASFDFSLPAGNDYAVIKLTGPTCASTGARCTQSSDCNPGILCENSNFGPYNLQLHVQPLVEAACCTGQACEVLNRFDCENHLVCSDPLGSCAGAASGDVCGTGTCSAVVGVWLGPGLRGVTGQGLTTLPPIFDCSANPCTAGACCVGPGQCASNGVLGNITAAACAILNPNPDAYVGGVNCLEKPCPACTLSDATQCQPSQTLSFGYASSNDLLFFHAEDMNPLGSTISQVCYTWFWAGAGGCGGGEPDEKWNVQIYDCDGPGGIPGTLLSIGLGYIEIATASKSSDPNFNPGGLVTYGLAFPPVDVTGKSCVWIEISDYSNIGCRGNWLAVGTDDARQPIGNNYGMSKSGFRAYDPQDLTTSDVTLCIGPTTAALGTGTGFDGGGGSTVGAACCDGSNNTCNSVDDAFDCVIAGNIFRPDKLCSDVIDPCTAPPNDSCAFVHTVNTFDIVNCIDANGPLVADDLGLCSDDPTEVCIISLAGAGCLGNDLAPGTVTCDAAPTTENYACDPMSGNTLFSTTDGPTGVPELDVPPDDDCGGLSVGSIQADTWHRVTAPCSGTMNVNMCGFGPVTDHIVEVFTNGCPAFDDGLAGTNLLGCNDDDCFALQAGIGADLGVTVFGGVEYTIRVSGLDAVGANDPGEAKTASQGSYQLDVAFVCTAVAPPSPPVAAAFPDEKPKMKYLSIDPSVNGGQPLAIRIEETTTGKVMWAGAPFDAPDVSAVSTLASAPLAMDWSAFSVINLTGCIIQPFGVYSITFVEDPLGVATSSMALTTLTAACTWGDIQVLTGPCDAGIGDIIEAININTFSPTAAFPNAHGDVQGDVMDGTLGINDIIAAINAVTVAAGAPLGYTEIAACP